MQTAFSNSTQSKDKLARDQLEGAFQLFNQMSAQLIDSYQQLQARVLTLSQELTAARNERMQQLAEKERLANRLSKLLDALPAAVLVLDGDNQVTQLNPAAKQFFPGIRVGQVWDEISCRQLRPEPITGDLWLNPKRLVNRTERSLSPEPGCILLFVDITETRALQDRVERQNRLSAMGEMAAQLAHQIRTPLSSALIYNSHLAKPDLSQVQRSHFSHRCRKRLQHIERQIGDMLSFARGSQFDPEPVCITPMLEELTHTLQPMLHERGAKLTFNDQTDSRCRISGNRDALLGAFVNLAENALDHGAESVHLRLILNQTQASLELDFCDNGPGIAEEFCERIFDPFFTTRSDGTGLGLAVVQSVILGHMGSICLQQPSVDGACFQIRLPLLKNHR